MTNFFYNLVLMQGMYLTIKHLKMTQVKFHNSSCKSWYPPEK